MNLRKFWRPVSRNRHTSDNKSLGNYSRYILFTASIFSSCAFCDPSRADPALDQSVLPYANTGFAFTNTSLIPGSALGGIGQSFTAGVSGRLDDLSVGLYSLAGYNSNFTLDVFDSSNKIIGSKSYSGASIPSSSTIDYNNPIDLQLQLSSANIYLKKGQSYSYAIVPLTPVTADEGALGFELVAGSNIYANGTPISYNAASGNITPISAASLDEDFQTYVTPDLQIAPFEVTGNRVAGGSNWNYSYSTEIKDGIVYVHEKIELTGDAPSPSLIGQWLAGMNGIWSNKFSVSDGTLVYPIVIDASFVNTGADQVVTYSDGIGDQDMLHWYLDNHWGLDRQGSAAAHELGHMLGLYDEYVGGAVDPSEPVGNLCVVGGSKTESDCLSLMSDLGPVQQRYFESILAELQSHTTRDLSLAHLPPGPDDYVQAPPLPGVASESPFTGPGVPEPSAYLLLILGVGAVGARLRNSELRKPAGSRRDIELATL